MLLTVAALHGECLFDIYSSLEACDDRDDLRRRINVPAIAVKYSSYVLYSRATLTLCSPWTTA